jgi:TonB-dependent receptor
MRSDLQSRRVGLAALLLLSIPASVQLYADPSMSKPSPQLGDAAPATSASVAGAPTGTDAANNTAALNASAAGATAQGGTGSQSPQASDLSTSAVSELSPVVVKATGISQEAAFDKMHDSLNKVNVLSEDQIDQTPAMTVGEAVQELPGVGVQHDESEPVFMEIRGMDENLNIITYDGVNIPSYDAGQRAVSVDDIPSGIVSNMEVYKVLLPNMDAEGIGGQLNLVPKTAADYPGGHTLEITAAGGGALMGGGDTPDNDNPLFNGSLTWANTFKLGGQSKLGVLFTALADNKQFAIQDLEEAYSSANGTPGFNSKSIDQYSERNEEYERLRAGLGLNVNLDVDPDNKYFASLMYGGYNEIRDPKLVTDLNDLDAGTNFEPGDTVNPDGSFTVYEDGAKNDIEKELTNVFTDFRTLATAWGGTNKMGGDMSGLTVSYKASYSYASQVEPIDDSFKFESLPGTIGGSVTYNNIPNNGIDPTINTSNLTGANNPANYYLKEADNGPSQTDVDEWGFQGDAKLKTDNPFDWTGVSSLFQFGFKARFNYTDYNQISYEDDATAKGTVANANAGNLVLLSDVPTSMARDGSFYPGGGFNLGVEPTLSGLQNTNLNYLNGVGNPATMTGWIRTPSDMVGDVGADYTAYENIYGIYGMDTLTWDKLQVMAGLRVEVTSYTFNYSDIYDSQNNVVSDPSQATPMTGYLNFINVLPGLGGKYEFTPQFQTRLNFSESVGRPTQQEYVPNVGESGTIPGTDPDAGNVLNVGNPNLKPILSYNYDSSWEWYPMKGAILGLDLFYKDINNYIVTDYALYDTAEAQNANAQGIVTYSNIPWSQVYGAEYQYQQQYTMLPWGLDGLGIRASASTIGSYCPAYIDAGHMLPSQSNLIWNGGVFYKAHGFTADIAGSFTGANISQVGDPQRGVPDYWYADYFQIDAKVSYAVNRNFSVFAIANNLNNAPLENYAGNPAYPLQDEFYGPSFTGGMKAVF